MKFLIIIPAHNEELNIGLCLKSLVRQTYRDFRIVVVDDGSSDHTAELTTSLSRNFPRIHCISLKKSEHQPGAKVVRTFNAGLGTQNFKDFDVICKFDADIIFPADYLQRLAEAYTANPKAGMISGLVFIAEDQLGTEAELKNGNPEFQQNLLDFSSTQGWRFEALSSKNHVRGPVKSYRKSCFEAINGLRPVLGWDNIDVLLTKMHGYEVCTLKDLWVKHLRPTAYKYKKQKAEKLGEYFYNLGLNFSLAMISAGKSAWKSKSFSEFFITMQSFLKQNHALVLSSEEISFIRATRWKEMLGKFNSKK